MYTEILNSGSCPPISAPSYSEASLYDANEVRALRNHPNQEVLRTIVDWCEKFLGRPSHLVGRTGNVCPFVPEAMMRGALKFAVVPLKGRGPSAIAEIERVVPLFRQRFLAEEKAQKKINIFGSWVMLFPDVATDDAVDVIDAPQRRMKPDFVKEGLMLGEFHPTSHSPGIRNPSFRPLRSPIPLLVIRHMVESDIEFLGRSFDPAPLRVQSLRAYLKYLGSSLSVASKLAAKEALRIAEAESSMA